MMTINELRSKVWANVKKNGFSFTWKEICSMDRTALMDMLYPKQIEIFAKPETIGGVTFTGKRLTTHAVEATYEQKCSKLSAFELQRAKDEIISRAEEIGCTPNLTWEEIWHTHKEFQHRVCHQKRGITKQVKVCGNNITHDLTTGYYTFDLSKMKTSTDVVNNVNEWLYEVAVPNADLMQTCSELGINLITFDPEGIEIPEGLNLESILTNVYTYGMKDVSKEDNNLYFPVGLSASKARSGGVIWLANVANWTEMEKLRAKVLHLSDEEYKAMKKDDCVIAKFETGTIGMRTSSVINVSEAGKKLRGDNSVLNNIRIKVVSDIEHEREIQCLVPNTAVTGDRKPFAFTMAIIKQKINYSDGTSIIKLQAYIDILHQAGEITDKQYQMFTTKWSEYNYDTTALVEDEELHRFLTSKDFKACAQIRLFGGIKGTLFPVAQMDGDERLADVDMLVFKKSAKYISKNGAPFEVINFSKARPEKAMLNYQFVQSTVTDANVLIKGAKRAFEYTTNVLKDSASTLKFIAGMRGLNDEGDDLMTKLAKDIEIEPRLITEHYHHSQILEKVEKYVKEVGYGKIPVKGNFKYIIVDPVYLYHQAMGDDFESSLNAGEVYCNGINGFEAGMWRSPMIHYSEPQKVMTKDVDYLWMYKDVIALNPYDAIAPALGGADYDGDKCLFVVDYVDGSFESDFVQQIQNTGYVIYDEGNVAPKLKNNIENRIHYYVALSRPNRTGQITNWATCVNDLMINARINNDTRMYNWYKSLLVRLRFAQGWEIDLPKTGVSADGPNGDMLPTKFCRPSVKPQWFVDMKVYEGRPVACVDKHGKSIVYKGNSPMEILHQYAEEFWNSILSGFVVTPNTMLEVIGETLTEKERLAFETIKNQVIEYERLYRNESRNIAILLDKGIISEEEQRVNFDELINKHEIALNSLLGGDVTTDVVAYACYYASNFRKDKNGNDTKVTGKRSYGWVCYYAQTLSLLYRNNNGMSLIALPNREMDSIEVINGELFIDGKFIQGVEYPDGSYSLRIIEDKPFITVPKKLPVITEAEKRQAEIAIANKQFMFECNAFTVHNQKLNSEQFVATIKDNNNIFDVLKLTNGSVALCMDGKVYALIRECPSAIIGRRVVLVDHGDLLFIPKANRPTTLMKDDVYAYSKNLRFTVVIKTDEVANTNVTIPTIAQEVSYNDNYSDITTEDLMRMYGM